MLMILFKQVRWLIGDSLAPQRWLKLLLPESEAHSTVMGSLFGEHDSTLYKYNVYILTIFGVPWMPIQKCKFSCFWVFVKPHQSSLIEHHKSRTPNTLRTDPKDDNIDPAAAL